MLWLQVTLYTYFHSNIFCFKENPNNSEELQAFSIRTSFAFPGHFFFLIQIESNPSFKLIQIAYSNKINSQI